MISSYQEDDLPTKVVPHWEVMPEMCITSAVHSPGKVAAQQYHTNE